MSVRNITYVSRLVNLKELCEKMESKTKHLSIGSPQPSKSDILRLYSAEFCPYAQRVRLVLQAKGLKYEAVNINLSKKPEWYSAINAELKVPVLDTGKEFITESVDIANYLEEKYPSPPLYTSDPEVVKKDKELIKQLDSVTSMFAKCMADPKAKTPDEWVKDFVASMEPLEKELKERNTEFFGGEKPGMADYMLWPWAERIKSLDMLIGQDLQYKDDIPTLIKWQSNMLKQPAVQAVYNGPEKFFKVLQMKYSQENPDFDSIYNKL